MNYKVSVGIVGAGYAGHLRGYAVREFNNERIELKGVYDRDPHHAEAYARELNIKRYSTLEDICNSNEINTISVSVPNRYHYEIVKYALERNRNIMCEYPLVLSEYRQSEELVDSANKRDLFLHVGQTMNYDADCRLIESYKEELGDLYMGYKYMSFGALGSWFRLDGFKGNYKDLGTWYVKDNRHGGWIVSAHYHGIQIFRKIFGEVKALCGFDSSRDGIAAASILMQHVTGASTTVQWGMPIPGKAFSTTIVSGRNGSVEVDGSRYLIHLNDRRINGELPKVNTFVEDLKALLDELDEKRDPNKEQEDMLFNLKIAFKAEESAAKGILVAV